MIGEKSPIIKKLAESIYSEEMIGLLVLFHLILLRLLSLEYMSSITGIKLSNQVDMSATLYTKGCHLLTHDDRLMFLFFFFVSAP